MLRSRHTALYLYILTGFPCLQIFGVLALMCAILAVGNYLWEINKGYQFNIFLPREDDSGGASLSAFLTFWSYVIILNTVVPISLYVRSVRIMLT